MRRYDATFPHVRGWTADGPVPAGAVGFVLAIRASLARRADRGVGAPDERGGVLPASQSDRADRAVDYRLRARAGSWRHVRRGVSNPRRSTVQRHTGLLDRSGNRVRSGLAREERDELDRGGCLSEGSEAAGCHDACPRVTSPRDEYQPGRGAYPTHHRHDRRSTVQRRRPRAHRADLGAHGRIPECVPGA